MRWFQKGWLICLCLGLLLTSCSVLENVPFLNFRSKVTSCPEIPIGVIIAADTRSEAQEQKEGYDLAEQEINQGEGVHGCPIRLVYNLSEGEGTNPEAVQAAMLELSDSGVVAILGATWNNASKRAAAISEYIRTPVLITPDTGDDILDSGSHWTFRINPPNQAYANASLEMVRSYLGANASIAILYERSEYGESAAVAAGNSALDQGLQISAYQGFSTSTKDYSAITRSLRAGDPQAIYLISSAAVQAQEILEAIKSQGLNYTYLIGNGNAFTSGEFLYDPTGALNPGLDLLIITTPWSQDLPWEGIETFSQNLVNFRESRQAAAARPVVVRNVQAYLALRVVAAAMSAAPQKSPQEWVEIQAQADKLAAYREQLAQSLRELRGSSPENLSGPVEFGADGQNKSEALLVQVIRGQMVTVYPEEYAQRAPIRRVP